MAEADAVLEYAQQRRAALSSGKPLEQALAEIAEALKGLLPHRTPLRERYPIPRPGESGTRWGHDVERLEPNRT